MAPEFNSLDDFNAAFLARQITTRSRLIPLRDCDDIADSDQHHITFRTGDAGWIQHSEKKRHETSISGSGLSSVYDQSRKLWSKIDEHFAIDLFNRTRSVIDASLRHEERAIAQKAIPLLDFDPSGATRGDILRRTSEVLSVTLGVTLVLVGAVA